VTALLGLMQQHQADYTNTFRRLSGRGGDAQPGEAAATNALPGTEALFAAKEFVDWAGLWWARLGRQNIAPAAALENMRSVNPAVIARNHKVEEALSAANTGDLSVLQKLLLVIANPFNEMPDNAEYRTPAPTGGEPYRTFCGT